MALVENFKEYIRVRRETQIRELIKNLDRDIIDRTRNDEAYYKTDNPPDVEEKLYSREMREIGALIISFKYKGKIVHLLNTKDIKDLNNFFYERAELWHEFRSKGLDMSKERLVKLLLLEDKSAYGAGDKLREMIAELENNERKPLNERENASNSQRAVSASEKTPPPEIFAQRSSEDAR